MKRPVMIVLALAALVPAVALAAAPPDPPTPTPVPENRPRIGLVLSGGGARGAAHVGVLKVLEELRIPVDYVAGTSMGSIVGGLYAAGMTPGEIEAILTGVDWDDAMTDSTSRDMTSFHRKREEQALTAKVRVGYRDGKLALPLGILQGQKLEMLLRELTLPVATVADFDDLPIPYRAVAADLETGRAVVLGKGDLAQAMRASMSVPAMLSPVEIDGRLLVDGGVIDNMPVGAARDLGADRIIAVDISTALSPLKEITSATAVNGQVGTMQTRSGTELAIASLKDQDILIVPDLGDIGFADFTRAADAVPLGEKAARAAAERLQVFSLSPEEWAAYKASLSKPSREIPVVREIRIRQNTHLSDAFILSRLTLKIGEPLDLAVIRTDILDLYGMDIFEKIGYDLVPLEGGGVALELNCRRKAWGPDYFQFGLTLQGDGDGNNDYNFFFRFNKLAMNSRGGEWLSDLRLGENMLLYTEFYQPFSGPGGYFFAPRAYWKRDPVRVYDPDAPSSIWSVKRLGAGLDLGKALGNWGEVRLGVDRESQDASREIGDGLMEDLEYDEGRAYLKFGADTLDRTVFATSGIKALAAYEQSFEALGATMDLGLGQVGFMGVKTWGRFTSQAAVNLGAVSEDGSPVPHFSAGGLGRLSGYGLDRIFGNYMGLARLTGHFRIYGLGLGPYDMPIYAGVTLEAGNVWLFEDDIGMDSVEYHGALYLGIDSLAGPIMLAYGRGDEGQSSFYFVMGWPFQ